MTDQTTKDPEPRPEDRAAPPPDTSPPVPRVAKTPEEAPRFRDWALI